MSAVELKACREQLGLTLRDVEEISKGAISNSYLSQLETGKIKNPSLDIARQLATIYCCKIEDIADALALPIPAVPPRCDCCGQSLLHAKFITDTRPPQGDAASIALREALAKVVQENGPVAIDAMGEGLAWRPLDYGTWTQLALSATPSDSGERMREENERLRAELAVFREAEDERRVQGEREWEFSQRRLREESEKREAGKWSSQ